MTSTKLSVSVRLTAIIGIFALLIGILVGITFIVTSAQGKDAMLINVAGRQRMLTQRLTKASLGYVTELREEQEAEKIADIVVHTRAHMAKSIAAAKKAGAFKLTADTLNFTPASSARQITTEFSKNKQMTLRQISRKYRNPENTPDAYDDRALAQMESEPEKWRNKSWSEKVVDGDKATMRYLRSLFVTNACMGCHSDPAKVPEFIRETYPHDLALGYKEGDLRGAVSVSWPSRIMSIDDHLAEFTQTRELFDTTLAALINGGTTTLGGNELALPACEDDDIRVQLNKVTGLWVEIASAVDLIFDKTSSDAAAFSTALDFVMMNNGTLLSEMDKVTQKNAAGAEESASASEELSAQAETMNGIVGQLALLVGGSSQNPTTATNAHVQSNKQRGLSREDQVFHGIAGGVKQTHQTRAATGDRAETMIPLDTDADCDDFSKFNN